MIQLLIMYLAYLLAAPSNRNNRFLFSVVKMPLVIGILNLLIILVVMESYSMQYIWIFAILVHHQHDLLRSVQLQASISDHTNHSAHYKP